MIIMYTDTSECYTQCSSEYWELRLALDYALHINGIYIIILRIHLSVSELKAVLSLQRLDLDVTTDSSLSHCLIWQLH